ncbi:MAG: CRISPR-associated protein [Verrucomicrobiaceae bacterium]|nr:CRISPR-associated protein [Verrucomicrobiaceae bacterium]
MYVLITYDVATSTEGGTRRLRQVAKTCLDYGQRVQNSVFECMLEPAQMVELRARLEKIIDPKHDSLRYYHLGNHWERRVDHVGAKAAYNVEGPLIV